MFAYLNGLELSVLTLLGAATLLSFYAGKGASYIRLPAVIGYMVLGILAGPSGAHVFTEPMLDQLGFITQIVLGYVAFTIGAELNMQALRQLGRGIVAIVLAESFGAFVVVTGLVYLYSRDWVLALVFGAMAPSSAPAGTVAVIQECRAKGPLTKAMYAVVGFDDGVAIIIFGFAAAMAQSMLVNEATGEAAAILPVLWNPLRELVLSGAIGLIGGLIFCQMIRRIRTPAEYFAIVFGTIMLLSGLCVRWHLSIIMTNMIVGFVLVNTRRERLVTSVNSSLSTLMPLMFILFFCLSGAHLELSQLPSLGIVGILYILGRSAGKISGARFGASFGKTDPNIKKYLGIAILSQAGVAIGLALILDHDLEKLAAQFDYDRAAFIGASVLNTVTATSIFFGIIAPILTKIAISRSGEMNKM